MGCESDRHAIGGLGGYLGIAVEVWRRAEARTGCENLVSRGKVMKGSPVEPPEVLRRENLPMAPPSRINKPLEHRPGRGNHGISAR